MQALYAYFKHQGESSISKSEKELLFSIQKTYDLYHYLLLLMIDLCDYAIKRIELAKNKKIPTPEDINPNTKFINNKIIAQLKENLTLNKYLREKKLSWINYPELKKNIYNEIIENEQYKTYMSSPERSYKEDKEMVCNLYKYIMSCNEQIFINLEEQSIYWNDEVEFVIGSIIKTLKKFKESDGKNAKLMPLYKSKDDLTFSQKLLRNVILKHEEYLEYIEKFSKNWDVDRIAFMDILIMQMAIGEVLSFSSIPVKVTLNEYLEISKYYSTQRSNIFINGILDKVFTYLKNINKIKKQGRGLIGEENEETKK
ncbi:MAG: transcription antitermination protein NusB [Bacteroidales bacterium]|nr:transcription antitermination protein NusB [Bacteroidales bacterium]